MFVAAARIALAIPEADSPKRKRQVVGKVVERIRGKFNASVAEVENSASWQRAVIGISVVGNERAFVQRVIDQIFHAIEDLYVAPIAARSVEIISLNSEGSTDNAWAELATKMDTDFSVGTAADGSDGRARDAASEGGLKRQNTRRNSGEDWPQVKTLADVEDPNDPEAAGYRAPVKNGSGQTSKRGKSTKNLTEEERAEAIRALIAEMKKPKG